MTTAGIASFARRMSLPMNGSSSFDYDESSANYTSGFYDDETAAASDVVADSWPDSAAQRRITLEHCQIFQFVLNSLAIGILCVFGIAGNTLSMIILQRDKHNRVAVFLLQALAVSDSSVLFIAFVVLSIFYGLLPLSGHADAVVRASPIFMQYINPLGYAVQSCTIWITVLLAVNRFIAVCKPFTAERLLTMRVAIAQVVVVVVLSFGLNVPRIFLYEFDLPSFGAGNATADGNATSLPNGRVIHQFSALGRDRVFEVAYVNTFYTAVVLVLPLILLSGFNLRIVLSLRESRRRMIRNSLRGTYDGRRESSITAVMIAVVAELIVCHLPDRVFMIVKYVLYPEGTGGPSCPDIMYFLENFFNLLVIVSSSTNFIIYFAMRRRFRDSLRRHLIICCCSVCCPKTVSRLRRQMSEDTFDSRRYVSGRAASWDVSGRAASLDGNGFNSNGSCRGSASGKAAIFSPLVPGAPSTPKRSQDSDVPLEIGHHHAGGASCWTSCIPHHARERQVIWKDLDEMAANAGGVRNGSLVPCGNLAMHGNGGTGMHNGHSGRVEYRSCADDRTHHHHNGTSMECSPLTSPELPIELTRLDRAGTESDNRDKTTQGEDEL